MYEWMSVIGIGLLIGVSFGILLEFRYLIEMDIKLEKIIDKVERLESKEIKILKRKKKK